MSAKIDSRLIGQTIKALRRQRGLTQDELADIVGYTVRNLRRIENNGTNSIDLVNVFADIFDVSAIDILDGDVFLIKIPKIMPMFHEFIIKILVFCVCHTHGFYFPSIVFFIYII